jgi:hypothetical protein
LLQAIRAGEVRRPETLRPCAVIATRWSARFLHPDSWSNLAALWRSRWRIPLAARQHAMRALQLDPRHADAWVNLGVASWHAGQHREGAQAMNQALQHVPGLARRPHSTTR